MSRERPLEGRTVLLTRPESEGRELAARLANLGARVVTEPVVAFESLAEAPEARSAAERVDRYDLLVFTSANGVRFFAEALRRVGKEPGDVRVRVAAVGPGTAKALRESGFVVQRVAAESRADGLAAELRGEVRPGTRVLWARAESVRRVLPEALAAAGAEVDEVAVYRTLASARAPAAAARLATGDLDAVVFASPSAVRLLLEAVPGSSAAAAGGLRRARRVAIGEVTAAALDRAGYPASSVAGAPTDDELESALLRSFRD
ncbi:MAG: uroporphyrinogen-III synthase [Acidobacteriia bacterium]|nr:uroporphyrinogen-III synthase [Terriglobia bacterium]